jgi:hypothetical protein
MGGPIVTIERTLRLIAGSLLLVSLLLAHYVSPNWLWFTAFIGLNLLQSGLTDWCPMMLILRKAGLRNHSAGEDNGH